VNTKVTKKEMTQAKPEPFLIQFAPTKKNYT